MSFLDLDIPGLEPEQIIRIHAAYIAAEVTGEGNVISALLSRAAQIEQYIETGQTRRSY